ncbi:MAG: nucleotidyltransferase domain-containing protein [Bacillota bacterium]|nr:nucleotidyltransferase domain-containing protein [Bacillota bacterium]
MQTGFSVPDRAVRDLILRLTSCQEVGLISLILFGGLTRGEWAPATSDIDLVCLLEDEVDGKDRDALDAIYDHIEAEDPDGYKALYVYHMPVESLRHPQFRAAGGPVGLPVGNHKRRAFNGFPMSVYYSCDIRNFGRTLYGTSADTAYLCLR